MNNLIFSKNNCNFEQRSETKSVLKNKIDFKKLKNNTCNSLNEVECFLNNFQKFTDYIKLYKIFK